MKGDESIRRIHKNIFDMVLPKMKLHQKPDQPKNLVVGIKKLEYGITKLEKKN